MSSEEMEASHLNHLLFVYGTLKQGEPNQDVIKTENKIDGKEQPQSQFIGKAETIEKYPLVIATKHNVPFLLNLPGTGYNVTGEIYEINDKMLEKLDIFEECPEYYIRRKECVRLLDTQKTAECWIYFLKGHHPNLIKLEMFNNYCSNGEHGLPYLESPGNESCWNDVLETSAQLNPNGDSS
ncbi:gamma-glutamylaminecyclotransferase C-like [Nilaparvata lugens]|uniref:gamma-glutamylaminecyclotransferase C-like n=1 Tax=Nilaparvata lugens TaxID=108931 RepID=UPI000B99CFAB|nr:gamma-glutamylaminecyclotransferase C-like [Nilaparvata lugens]